MLDFSSLKKTGTDNVHTIIENEKRGVAIIGIGIKLPFADNLAELDSILSTGKDCITGLPLKRQYDVRNYIYHTKGDIPVSFSEGAFLKDIDTFDYAFFGISPKEASLMSPEQRIFTQTTWQAIEDAGYGGEKLYGSNTGVFIGYGADAPYQYKRYIELFEEEYMSMAVTGNMSSVIASRISHMLDLRGMSLSVDTACSSSLTALHLAYRAIDDGEMDQAVVGSIRINHMPIRDYLNFGVHSADGRTRAFDDESDGTGSGEGSIVLLLKSFHKAVQDQDDIYAVIRGSATNQDGKSLGISAPNVVAQQHVLETAFKNADVQPTDISYLEAHGTGTRLGDPIEIDAITKAFGKYTDKKMFCGIGTIKTNYGHLDHASGMAGIVKAILSLKYKKLYPNIHFSVPNRNILFEDSPVYVIDRLIDWNTEGKPLICGVSAFGFSGTNCHIVLEEAPEIKMDNLTANKSQLFLLSAKTSETLKILVKTYLDFLRSNRHISISALCNTLGTGRWHYEKRIALLADDLEELIDKLAGISANKEVDISGGTPQLRQYAVDYLNNKPIPYGQIFKKQKIHLPTYPFKNSRNWVDDTALYKSLSDVYYYELNWRQAKGIAAEERVEEILVISDGSERSEQIITYLRQSGYLITICNYGENLQEEHIENHKTVLFSVFLEKAYSLEQLNQNIEKSLLYFYSVIKSDLCKKIKNRTRLFIIGNYANAVEQEKATVIPEVNALFHMGKAVIWEQPLFTVRCIDLDAQSEVKQLLYEINSDNREYMTAYRQNQRYVEYLEHANINPMRSQISVKDHGVYIIAGGMGGLGLQYARWISSMARGVKIILLNRSDFPRRDVWPMLLESTQDIELKEKIKTLIELEETGSEVQLICVDIADSESMENQVKDLKKQYQSINGVIHCAGISSWDYNQVNFCKVIRPKINGTFLLDKLVQELEPEFYLMNSSAITLVGGIGSGAYTAGNAYMNAFCYTSGNVKKFTVNWPVIRNTGLSRGTIKEAEKDLFCSISPELAIALSFKALGSGNGNLFIGKWNHACELMKLSDVLPFQMSRELTGSIGNEHRSLQETETLSIESVRLAGRENEEYSDVELTVAGIWKRVLGIEEIDIDDNFMEVGGDSIMLTKVLQLLNEAFGDCISISDLFAYPTIAEIAAYIHSFEEPDKTEEVQNSAGQDISELVEAMKDGTISLEHALDQFNLTRG